MISKMKHMFTLIAALQLMLPFCVVQAADPILVTSSLVILNAKEPSIDQIWLGHRSHDPGKLVVNWISKEPGESIVRFGRTDEYGQEVRIADDTTLHHVEIPLEETGGVYHYSVHTGNQSSKGFTF